MRPRTLAVSSARMPRLAAALAIAVVAWGCESKETIFVAPPPVAPAAPQGVYSVTGDNRVSLFWIRNTELDFNNYAVWRGPAYDGPFTLLGKTKATSWVDDTAVNGATYFYAISAFNTAGQESDLSVESVFDTPRPEGFNLTLVNSELGDDVGSGYDFSSGLIRRADDPLTDVFFYAQGGLRLLVARDVNTDVQDAGYLPLEDLDWAPDDGWSPTGEVELIPGHSFYVWTRDNHYAKVECVAVSANQVTLNWAYQLVPGNPELKPHPRSSLGNG